MAETRLLMKNMQFYGYHGVFNSEQELGQRIEVDVELYRDFRPAGVADDLRLTVNYSEIFALVKQIVQDRKFRLIEAIATAILSQIQAAYDVTRVTVRVRKPQPPVGGLLETVEFEISDSK